jgi:acetylornithine/succinyldiaminopimelate/putrescine aminotransferase
MECFRPGSHGSTFGGYPIGARVAQEVITFLRENNFTERVENLGLKIRKELQSSNLPMISEIRGQGLMIGLELEKGYDAEAVADELLKFNLLVGLSRKSSNVIRLQPPLVITDEEVDYLLTNLTNGLRWCYSNLKSL